jgi:uncharacterized membrane-anchored protein YhcB (DUF1043 family)
MTLTSWFLFVTILLVGILLGYLTGRKTGRKEGFQEGMLYAPLELRRRALLDDFCLTCGREMVFGKKNE